MSTIVLIVEFCKKEWLKIKQEKVGCNFSKLRLDSHNVEGAMDDPETHVIRLWEQDVGFSIRAMESRQLCSYTRMQAVRVRVVH